MPILLNLLVFSAFMYWFWKQFITNSKKLFIGIVLLFLVASCIVFIVSLYAEHDYLDGLSALIAGGISITAFWISTSAIIIWKNVKEKTMQHLVADLLLALPLILIPLLLWLLLSNASYKIGG